MVVFGVLEVLSVCVPSRCCGVWCVVPWLVWGGGWCGESGRRGVVSAWLWVGGGGVVRLGWLGVLLVWWVVWVVFVGCAGGLWGVGGVCSVVGVSEAVGLVLLLGWLFCWLCCLRTQ